MRVPSSDRIAAGSRRAARRALNGIGLARRVEIPADLEPEFVSHYQRCRPFTMCSVERQYALYNSMAYLARERIAGDVVECGVWCGGSAMLAALCAAAAGDRQRTFSLYDTFGPFPAPGERDDAFAWAVWREIDTSGRLDGRALPGVDEVRRNMLSTGISDGQLRIVPGRVEETLPAQAPERIALLRLDTDWYESTRHELEHLYPLLAPGGVLIIDDYGCMNGARAATDEFISRSGAPLLLTRIDDTARLAIKPLTR
jgi:predicted O-methyltransferase YrrM